MSLENHGNETMSFPEDRHWSGVDFERYLLKVIENKELIDFNNAPREIDLSKSVIGTTADKLGQKLDQGKRYEYGAEIRLKGNNLYATKLTTDYSFITTTTHTPLTETGDILRAIFYKTNKYSKISKRFPPEKELFRLHSHPIDVPVSSKDTNTISQLKESELYPWEIDSSRCGFLVVAKSKRMLVMATRQSPVFDSIEDALEEIQKVIEENKTDETGLRLTKMEFKLGLIPPEKYPGTVKRSAQIYTDIARRMNYLMYASKDMKDFRNVYSRSY